MLFAQTLLLDWHERSQRATTDSCRLSTCSVSSGRSGEREREWQYFHEEQNNTRYFLGVTKLDPMFAATASKRHEKPQQVFLSARVAISVRLRH